LPEALPSFIAAEYLSDPEYGRGKMFGGFTGIRPSEVVIIGAGTVGDMPPVRQRDWARL